MSPEAQDILGILCKEINKKYGTNTLCKLNAEAKPLLEEVIRTSSIGLDVALGIGGYKKGRIIEVYGPNASGKTTLSLHAIANAQKNGSNPVFIDLEHALDPLYSQNLDVDLDNLLISQPEDAETALDIIEMCAKTPGVGLIVVDSVSALVPRAELEGEMGDQSIGLQARLMSKAMRKLVGSCNRTNTTIMFLNQLRATISGFGYGPKETTGGGAALKYYSSQRLDIRSVGKIKQGENIVGNKTRVKVVKNKLASPFKQAEFDIIFGKGIDSDGELVDLATEDKIIVKSGAWYKYEDESIAQGRPNAVIWLNENPEIKEKIKQEILSNRGLD
jgi:recombination protein RecA